MHASITPPAVCHLCTVRLVDSSQYVSAGGYAECCLCLSVNVGVYVDAFIQKRGEEEGGGCV